MTAESVKTKPVPQGPTTLGEVMASTLGGKSGKASREKLIELAEQSESAVGVLSKLLR